MNALVTLERQLQPLTPHFAQVLPKHLPPERLMRTIMVSVERLPQLLECDRQSIFNAAMSAACLGLEVDGVTGQAYLIPFKGKAQLIVGYKGFNTLAARSGITISGGVVREGDGFEYELGSSAFVRHVPKLGNKGARIIAAYATATAKDRPAVVVVMDIDELMAVKGRSPGAKRSDSPWNDPSIGFPAMCEKTAKRRLARAMPLNVMQLAARMEEAFEEQGLTSHIDRERTVVIEGEVIAPRHSDNTPSAQELIAPATPERRPAEPAASGPAKGHQTEAAGDVPSAATYYEWWKKRMQNATRADQIGSKWNGEKDLHQQIEWTDEHPYEALKDKVVRAAASMKAPA